MGREQPVAMQPNTTRRVERAQRARETVNKTIPEMLRASPRTRHGLHRADVIVDPPALAPSAAQSIDIGTHIKIRLQCTDTLGSAAKLSERPYAAKRADPLARRQQGPNVTVLNMASSIRPGGGFLDGANSQEEFLCTRTTLHASLSMMDRSYPLPEVGGIYSPDVLVYKDSMRDPNLLEKRDQYFVDVISAGMFRFPDARGRNGHGEAACSCGVSYCDDHRDLVVRKMKAVIRMAESKGAEKLVLGAWGCGAYANPASEVAKLWRKVIAGGPRQRRPNAERWNGIKEVVFAIPDRGMLREFERAFSDVLCRDPITPPLEEPVTHGAERPAQDQQISDLISRINETEMQLDQVVSTHLRRELRNTLASLNKELARGLANKAAQEEDLTLQEDEEVDDFIISGFPGSDGEDNSFYNFDENDVASDSSDAEHSEVYEFRPRNDGPSTPPNRTDDPSLRFPPSPQFDVETGWFNGSMDGLQKMLRLTHVPLGSSRSSHGSPVMRSGSQDIDELAIDAYLSKYGGTDDIVEGVASLE